MEYDKIVKGRFLSRPNRFVAQVEIDGECKTVHVKNTGRCRELLVDNATVYLEDFRHNMGARKLEYSLVAVEKETPRGTLTINMDSQAPNKVVAEALRSGRIKLPGMDVLDEIKPEAKYGNSRLDFYVRDKSGREGYVEVKGVTLETDGVASFPDAPTERGIKHLNELVAIREKGYMAYVIFVIQMSPMSVFCPNDQCHRAFGDALRRAEEMGVEVLAYQCRVTPKTLDICDRVKVDLKRGC